MIYIIFLLGIISCKDETQDNIREPFALQSVNENKKINTKDNVLVKPFVQLKTNDAKDLLLYLIFEKLLKKVYEDEKGNKLGEKKLKNYIIDIIKKIDYSNIEYNKCKNIFNAVSLAYNIEMVEALKEAGAKITYKTNDNVFIQNIIIGYAKSQEKDFEKFKNIIELFIELGLDVNKELFKGEFILIGLAGYTEELDDFKLADNDIANIIGFLIDKGANFEFKTYSNMTPLLIALENKKKEKTIKTLFDKHANINVLTESGRSTFLILLESQKTLESEKLIYLKMLLGLGKSIESIFRLSYCRTHNKISCKTNIEECQNIAPLDAAYELTENSEDKQEIINLLKDYGFLRYEEQQKDLILK